MYLLNPYDLTSAAFLQVAKVAFLERSAFEMAAPNWQRFLLGHVSCSDFLQHFEDFVNHLAGGTKTMAGFWERMAYPCREQENISHLGERKIIFKSIFGIRLTTRPVSHLMKHQLVNRDSPLMDQNNP